MLSFVTQYASQVRKTDYLDVFDRLKKKKIALVRSNHSQFPRSARKIFAPGALRKISKNQKKSRSARSIPENFLATPFSRARAVCSKGCLSVGKFPISSLRSEYFSLRSEHSGKSQKIPISLLCSEIFSLVYVDSRV